MDTGTVGTSPHTLTWPGEPVVGERPPVNDEGALDVGGLLVVVVGEPLHGHNWGHGAAAATGNEGFQR